MPISQAGDVVCRCAKQADTVYHLAPLFFALTLNQSTPEKCI